MADSWRNLDASSLAERGWTWEQFEEAAFYAKDTLLGDLIPFSEFQKVENRPCDVMRATLHHKPYNVYRYRDNTIFIPQDFGGNFDDVISFGANDFGFTYSIVSMRDGNLENTVYSLDLNHETGDEVKFSKLLIQAPVDSALFQREVEKAGSQELFFAGKRFLRFFENNPNTVRKVVEIVKTPKKTEAYAEDVTNVRASLDKFLSGQREYTPVANPDAPLFEIADSFDIHNVK